MPSLQESLFLLLAELRAYRFRPFDTEVEAVEALLDAYGE